MPPVCGSWKSRRAVQAPAPPRPCLHDHSQRPLPASRPPPGSAAAQVPVALHGCCYNCGMEGHISAECTNDRSASTMGGRNTPLTTASSRVGSLRLWMAGMLGALRPLARRLRCHRLRRSVLGVLVVTLSASPVDLDLRPARGRQGFWFPSLRDLCQPHRPRPRLWPGRHRRMRWTSATSVRPLVWSRWRRTSTALSLSWCPGTAR
jgi:hypothetical protein